jgi:hemoglobin
MNESSKHEFGTGAASFDAARGEEGINKLVDDFYALMGTDARFSTIFNMHPKKIDISIDKLQRFLCGWLGGPHRYNEAYGSISIPLAHEHLDIGPAEHDQWLGCMGEAIDAQPFVPAFKAYLKAQLAVPAASILLRTNEVRGAGADLIPAPFGVKQP